MIGENERDLLLDLLPNGHPQSDDLNINVHYHYIQVPIKIELPTRSNHFNMLFFEQGAGEAEIDGVTYFLERWTVLVIFPGQFVSCDLKDGTKAHHLSTKPEVYESISSISHISVNKLKPISIFKINEPTYNTFLHEILKIKEIIGSKTMGIEEVIINRFKTIYLLLKCECINVREEEIQGLKHPVIHNLIKLINANFKKNKQVSFYAKELNIQPNYLNILCQNSLKISVKQLIKNRIVAEAKYMLIATDRSIKQITFELGIKDASQFTNLLKKETGFMPRDYLKIRRRKLE